MNFVNGNSFSYQYSVQASYIRYIFNMLWYALNTLLRMSIYFPFILFLHLNIFSVSSNEGISPYTQSVHFFTGFLPTFFHLTPILSSFLGSYFPFFSDDHIASIFCVLYLSQSCSPLPSCT